MKANKKTVKKLSFIVIAIALLVLSVTAVMVSASDGIQVIGEMIEIKESFDADYLVQDTATGSDDYVGDYQYTIYYDTDKGDVKTSYFGTPVIIYTINHPAVERIGTDSNETIIGSMLDSGYIVIVMDFLNNYDAKGTDLEYSTQQFSYDVLYGYGKVFTNTNVFPNGTYRESFVVPSGYNVLLNNVFWEIDKHSVDGTFEKIVENWNSDFRATKGDNLVRWMHTDGTRKAVQNDFDGNAPVWYDADGNVDANGEYTYIKYTKAEVITDCIDPDGSFLDMNLYLHIIYPTTPDNEVPVMALASSSGYPHSAPTDESNLRPQSTHFLYDGYAFAVFDYLWQPMGRNASWGYYDGAQGVSNDHMNYSLHIYNDKLVNTAAMRFIRYTSLAGGDTYKFDLDKIGVYGNSKGGWFNFLGEQVVQSPLVDATAYSSVAEIEDAISMALESFTSDRTYDGYHGATRYSVGAGAVTGDGITLAAGEKQPWLTYGGEEIISGCQITVPENGGSAMDITEGHVPIYVTSNMTDYLSAQYGVTLNIYNECRELDLPLLHLELPIGHALPTGQDINYNVDSYDIFGRFANYYLKNDAISIAYVVPMDNAGGVDATDKITIAFVGQAELDEVKKITVTASDGTEVFGTWESSFGKVVWTFTPDSLSGSTEYTVNIPADFSGTNGTPMGEAYTTSFITEFGKETKPESVSENVYTFIAPEFTTGNGFVFRFNVTNDAANIAEVYAGSADGEKLGDVNLRGAGSYEIDITDYVAANAGKEITLVLKAGRTAGETEVKSDTLSGETVSDVTLNTTNVSFTYGNEIGDRNALGASLDKAYNYTYSKYYNNPTKILTYKNVTGGEAVTKDDLGRLYTFSVDIYDTVDRVIQLRLRSMTDQTGHQTIDYDNVRLNLKTVANEWTTYTFTYRVYEPDYGSMSVGKVQYLDILASPDGDTASPIYISNLVVTEIVTEIDVANAVIAETREGSFDYSAPVSIYPFAIYNGETLVGEYDGWAAVLAAYTSGYTIKLQSDYTFTDADVSNKLGSFDKVNLDLGAYTITLANTANSLVWIKATDQTFTEVNVTGGMILIGDTPIVSYESASASGSGKNVNVNFTGVDIGLADHSMATNLISATSLTSGITLKSTISFTDCEFDLPDAKRAYDAATVFPAASSLGLDLEYTLQGGSISLTSERWLTLLENTNSVKFIKDADENYTTLIMPKSYTYPLTGSYFTENGYASYAAASEENNIVTYAFAVSENSTEYGVIPDEYMDSTTYPFVLFKDGSFVSAHKTITAVSNAARTLMSAAGCEDETAEILLRADHTTTGSTPEFGISRGTIIFDLGGHTLTRGNASFVGETLRESYPTSYKTSIVFKNGRLETAKSSMFTINNFYSTNSTKYYDFTFENVTFGSASGATGLNQAIWLSSWLNNNKVTTINTKITLRDCIFDLQNNKPTLSSTASLFSLGTYEAVFDLVIEGGTIIGDGSNVKIAAVDSYDSLTLAPNAKGEYLKFIPSSGGTAPNISNFNFDDGKYRTFVLNEETGEYLLSEGGVETPYGTIPAEYADAEEFPFVFFVKENGEYVCKNSTDSPSLDFAYDNWNTATTNVPNFSSSYSDVVILLRRDYTDTAIECSNNAFTSVDGKLTVDFGGFTMICKKALAFSAMSTSYKNCKGEIIIKNGKLLTTSSTLCTNNKNTSQSVDKYWDITFEDVTFGFAEGATTYKYYRFWLNWDNGGSSSMLFTIKMKNCTFDLKSNHPGSTPGLFSFIDGTSTSNTEFKFDVDIQGGTIISDDLSNVTLFKYNAGSDTITFSQNENGEYLKLISTSTAKDYSHYNKELVSGNGQYFVEISDDGINSVYELTSLETSYGTAPATAKYLSAVDYPFFIFQNGNFVSAAENWKSAMSAALALVDGEDESELTAEIVMRRDYDIYKATEGSVNFNTARGTIIADLGGYKITTVDGYFIDISISNSSASYLGYESHLIVRNGTLLNQRSSLPCIGIGHSGTSSSGEKKTLSFTFEDVTFKTTGYSIMRDWGHSGATGLNVNVVFDNCIYDFDYHNGDEVMFHFNSGNARVVTNATFIGGKIIAPIIGNYRLINNRSEDTVIFAKDDNGNYTTLVQPTKYTTVAPNDTFVNENGVTLAFIEEKTEGYNTIYKLISTKPENLDFKPKTSIVLGSELVYNVYVPQSGYLTSFTLDGIEYTDPTAIENIVTLSDGNDYYLIPVALKAAEAARDVVLAVNVTVDGTSYSGTFTMSVPKYAKKVIELETSTEVEKTLVKDVLAYIRSAYVYFNSSDKDTVLAAIDEILGDYTNEFSKAEGESNTEKGLYAAQLILRENPVIRFYLAEGMQKESYTFKYGNKVLEYGGEGTAVFDGVTYNYVDISLYAYQLIGEITYTDGTNNGSYHINSYVDFVTTDEAYKDNTDLIALVEKLYNYAKSAEAYRAYVLANS